MQWRNNIVTYVITYFVLLICCTTTSIISCRPSQNVFSRDFFDVFLIISNLIKDGGKFLVSPQERIKVQKTAYVK